MAGRIEDYALIGDCETAALVARDGSIDWLCWPRFDSGAVFASLLGGPEHGRFLIAPTSPIRMSSRRYRDETLVLETTFVTDGGSVTVTDWMPPRRLDPARVLAPDLVRLVRCEWGHVHMKAELLMRFDHGAIVPWVRRINRGVRATAGPDTVFMRTDVPLEGRQFRTFADFSLTAGETRSFTLTWVPTHEASVIPPERNPMDSLIETESFWRTWAARGTHDGGWQPQVRRSLLTLKALTYQPTGGVVAAATTSLPEKIGGVRNWDYRHCWLRDATYTLYAFMANGYLDEAVAWRQWLVNAVAGNPSRVQIMYGLAGERRLLEHDLDWLPGYENSRPVRSGNAAYKQHQLDVFGEVMDTLHMARSSGMAPDENAGRVERAMMRFLENDWCNPDEGIWEVRGPRRHFTHSKVMAWVAADRAARSRDIRNGDPERWRRLANEIRADIMRHGFDNQVGSFVQHYGSTEPDASLLMLPLVGFISADDPRMVGTVNYIESKLSHDGFIRRYQARSSVDGLPGDEGVFLLCTFWWADNLALQGHCTRAREVFDRLLGLRNDVGLLSEQYDPLERRLLGNFPQAFSHVGLVNTARILSEEAGRQGVDRQRCMDAA
jgi:GH15 family glucan-1,4-alpha-glucosidase